MPAETLFMILAPAFIAAAENFNPKGIYKNRNIQYLSKWSFGHACK